MDSNDLEACWKKCCYFWFHSEVKFFTRFDVFLDLVIFAYFNATLIDFYALKSFICIFLCNFHIFTRDNADIKDLKCLKNSNEFLMYLFM